MVRKIYVCTSGCTDGQPCFIIMPDDEGVKPRYCHINGSREMFVDVEELESPREAAELLKTIIKEKMETLRYKVDFLSELLQQVDEAIERLRSETQ